MFLGPFCIAVIHKKWFTFKNGYLSFAIPAVAHPPSLHEPSSVILASVEVQWVFRLVIEMKQDIEAKMKDKTSVSWVGFGGLYFFHSLEGHLHVPLLEQGVYLQKRHIDVINPTAAHGILPQA